MRRTTAFVAGSIWRPADERLHRLVAGAHGRPACDSSTRAPLAAAHDDRRTRRLPRAHGWRLRGGPRARRRSRSRRGPPEGRGRHGRRWPGAEPPAATWSACSTSTARRSASSGSPRAAATTAAPCSSTTSRSPSPTAAAVSARGDGPGGTQRGAARRGIDRWGFRHVPAPLLPHGCARPRRAGRYATSAGRARPRRLRVRARGPLATRSTRCRRDVHGRLPRA